MSNVHVAGVGMINFTKPGDPKAPDYHLAAAEAMKAALADSGLAYEDMQQVHAGYVYGDSCCGMRAAYEVGQTGIPIFNYNSNCSTGSSAIYGARQAIQSGAVDVALVVGFEKMEKGALGVYFNDRMNPGSLHGMAMVKAQGYDPKIPGAAQMFGGAGAEYQEKYGTKDEVFAQIQVKARQHAKHNPKALFKEALTVEEILASPKQFGPLTRLQCCPPTCGAASAVLCSEEYAKKHGLADSVKILAQHMETDSPDSFAGSMYGVVGYGMSQRAANKVFETTGFGAEDMDVIELHDCFTSNELLTYESLGLTPEGTAEKFIADGDNTYGGKFVVNPSGGLLSKGHPLGATGLAQCYELVNQLRGSADKRQVEGAKLGLQHNIGIGGAVVITMYGI
ncbi:MAG: lipid-transfer protein [Pseudomonadales bacterium]|nr:lipid-transfer protein [Pseudomonadales bacterium]